VSTRENYLYKAGADRLAHRIERYWGERGAFVTCTVEPVPGSVASWQVRSDINVATLTKLPK
jgi:hypothetical protein